MSKKKQEKPQKPRKICILGTTPSRMQGPIEDPEWELWTIGPGGKDAHRWDALFELHRVWPEDFAEYLNDLSNVKPPQKVYTLVSMPEAMERWAISHGKDLAWLKEKITGDWKANVVINREQIFDKFLRRMWFSSSISYCIALAMQENVTDMALFGIDLEAGEEYIAQFSGCAHLIDVARGSGINVYVPRGCGLMRDLEPYPDRYETPFALYTEQKVKWMTGLFQQKQQESEQAKLDLYRAEGQFLQGQQRGLPLEEMQQLEQALIQQQQRKAQADAEFFTLQGELNATNHYRRLFVFGQKELMD